MENLVSEHRFGSADFRTLPLSEMDAIVSRFEERVNAAQAANPPTRDMVRKAIRRQGAPRCPLQLKRLSTDVIVRYGDALADLYCQFPDDVISVKPYDPFIAYQPPERTDRIDPLRAMMQASEWTDEWGTRWGHAFGGVGATPTDYPLKDWSQLDDYLAKRMPDPHTPGRLEAARAILALHGESKYCVGMISLSVFERLHSLRGMQNTFTDLYTNETEVNRLCGALADYMVELVREWGKTNVSGILVGDDWGSQRGLMIAPEMWRRLFKPHYRRIFDEIHRVGKDAVLHSCGNVLPIIPDLIDLGLDILDPVQPGPMDLNEVARRFGGHISFWGGIDDQRLESVSPQEVKDMVRRAIDVLGRPFGCGYIVATANTMVPSLPFENIQAFFEASHEQ